MRRAVSSLVLAVLLALPAAAARIQRQLVDLQLGDTRDVIEKVYPPRKDWKSYKDKAGFEHIVVGKDDAKGFPEKAAEMRLILKRGRLVLLQLVYDAEASRKKPLGELVDELALAYGEPHRAGEAYWWGDSGVVVRAKNAELPVKGGDDRVELRTSLELMVRDVFRPR
jgi:hypothetical protein